MTATVPYAAWHFHQTESQQEDQQEKTYAEDEYILTDFLMKRMKWQIQFLLLSDAVFFIAPLTPSVRCRNADDLEFGKAETFLHRDINEQHAKD